MVSALTFSEAAGKPLLNWEELLDGRGVVSLSDNLFFCCRICRHVRGGGESAGIP